LKGSPVSLSSELFSRHRSGGTCTRDQEGKKEQYPVISSCLVSPVYNCGKAGTTVPIHWGGIEREGGRGSELKTKGVPVLKGFPFGGLLLFPFLLEEKEELRRPRYVVGGDVVEGGRKKREKGERKAKRALCFG